MALQFTVDILPTKQANKLTVVKTAVIALPTANQLVVAFGDGVSKARQVEILNAWKFLYDGIRDRALLDNQFAGSIIVSATDINKISEFDRRTSSDLLSTTATDVIVMVGSGMGAGLGKNALVMIETGFKVLREFALENELRGIQAVPTYSTPVAAITVADGTWSVPAALQLSTKLWQKGTIIQVTGTTTSQSWDSGPVTLTKDLNVREVAYKLSEYLKGWDEVTFDSIPHPTDDTIVIIRGLAGGGGLEFTFDTAVVTPVTAP